MLRRRQRRFRRRKTEIEDVADRLRGLLDARDSRLGELEEQLEEGYARSEICFCRA